MNPYDYTPGEIRYNVNLVETTPRWFRYVVDFPTAHPTPHERHNTVRGEYYRPKTGESFPLAILVHGMGDFGAVPCKFLARTLVKKGFACFVLYQIFHSCRLAESWKGRVYDLTSDEWFEAYRISVIDVRQVVDWAYTVPEIDKERISAVGISFGGFVSSIAMGLDRRIRAGIFLVSGGNSSKMVWRGNKRYMKRWNHYTETEYNKEQSQYLDYLDRVLSKGMETVPAKQSYLTDPMTYGHLLRGRPVMLINARWDEAVPRESTLDFWESCGRPQISWFPSTHPTLWAWYPLITRRMLRFLNGAQPRNL